jgi:23S rRNA pseudouridine1911/1915/1917 synthase
MSNELNVLYEDSHCLVVEKPFNLSVQADSSNDKDLLSLGKDYIKEKYEKPGNVFLGLVHRLDRPAGGVVILARRSKAAARLSKQFRLRTVKKIYRVMVEGRLRSDSGKMVDYLAKDRDANKSKVVSSHTEGAKKAILDFTVIERRKAYSILEITLETGRSHQIRVQLASRGAPVVGDLKYGAKRPLPNRNISLFAYSIEFAHPVTGERLWFRAEPPETHFFPADYR